MSKAKKQIEVDFVEDTKEEQAVECIAVIKVGLTRDYVARTYKIVGDKVVSFTDTEQNDKRIALDLAKIAFVKLFDN